MLVVGVVAFAEDLVSAALLYRGSRTSLNLKSAFLHMVGDTLATVAVIVGSLAIMFFDFHLIDPILTLLISAYILVHCSSALRESIRILMQSVPRNIDFDEVVAIMESVDDVESVHHVHIWMLDEHSTALEAHVVVAGNSLEEVDTVKRRMKEALLESFGIGHTTLEIEHDGCAGSHDSVIPFE